MESKLYKLAYDLSFYSPALSNEIISIIASRKKWKRHNPSDRLKRKKWLRSPSGKRYLKNKSRIEKRQTTKNKRERSRHRGIHYKYTWL